LEWYKRAKTLLPAEPKVFGHRIVQIGLEAGVPVCFVIQRSTQRKDLAIRENLAFISCAAGHDGPVVQFGVAA